MMRARLLAAVAVAIAFAAAAAPAHADVVPGVQIGNLDPVPSTASIDAGLNRAQALGAKIVRTEMSWALAEPRRGVFSERYLKTVRYLVDGAASRGMKTLLLVLRTPCWASSAPGKRACRRTTPRAVSAYPPADPATFGPIAGLVAQRFAPKLAAIEVWNEPDHYNELYFAGPDKVSRYAALLKVAYPAIKAQAPDLTVLAGALVGANGKFLQALYDQGIKGSYDALSVHYYDLVLASLRAIRQTMTANGDDKPLWLGEFGWPTCAPRHATEGGHACVTKTVQALALGDVFRGLNTTPWVQAAVVYAMNDAPASSFGLIDRRGIRKPAFATLRSLFTAGAGAARVPTLHLSRRGSTVRASGSGPAGDALELDVYRGGQLRYKATFRLDRNLRYDLRLPAVLGTSGLEVRVYQYWSGGGATRHV